MLRRADQSGIRLLTLDRPPVNALTLEFVEQLTSAFDQAQADVDCRACIVTGATGVFSGGIDVKVVPAYDNATRSRIVEAITELVAACYGIDKPLVAAVPGHAIGAGLILMLMSDYRIAARGEYRIGLTEAAAGLPFPAGPLEIIGAELSPELGRRLALGSETYPVDDPMFAGLIDEYVEPDDLLGAAGSAVERLAAMPAFGMVKAQFRRETRARIAAWKEGADPVLEALGLD